MGDLFPILRGKGGIRGFFFKIIFSPPVVFQLTLI